jgi:uncharacterized membrane protein YhaH (DUF805 family)
MMKSFKDLDQKLFDAAVNFGHKMIDKGYVRAWFSWLEWIGLTAIIFVAAKRAQSNFLYVIGAFSVIILFFVGLAGVEKLRDQLFPSIRTGKIVILVFAMLISVIGLLVVIYVMFELLPASIK